MSSGREGVSEVHTKQFDLINLVDARQWCTAGVRKCLLFGLQNIISTILSLLIVSLLCLDQSSRWPNSLATSTDDFSATSKVVSSAYLIIRLCSDIGLRSMAYTTNNIGLSPEQYYD